MISYKGIQNKAELREFNDFELYIREQMCKDIPRFLRWRVEGSGPVNKINSVTGVDVLIKTELLATLEAYLSDPVENREGVSLLL